MKRIMLIICSAFLLFTFVGCGATDPETVLVPLTEEESKILEAMESDINVVTDEDYSQTVLELQAHPETFSGKVYQLEGVFTTEKINGVDAPFVYRTLDHEGEKTTCGLPMKYLEKELSDGAWIRVTAILNTEDYGGETFTVMEVVAVETLAKAGQFQLEWDGISHQH